MAIYLCRDQGFLSEESFYCRVIYLIIFPIDLLSRSSNFISSLRIIGTDKGSPLAHVSRHTKVLDTVKRNQTTGAGTRPKVTNAGYENPE